MKRGEAKDFVTSHIWRLTSHGICQAAPRVILYVFAILVAIAAPATASTLTGRAVNQTANVSVPQLEIKLVIHSPDTAATLSSVTDSDGEFSFDLSAFPDAPQLFLTTHFDHIDTVQPVDPAAEGPVRLDLYERSDSDTAIAVSSHHVILDTNAGEIIHVLITNNRSNRTYLGGEGHGHGMEVLLSEGADEILSGPDGAHTHGRVLIDPRPVKPGTSQLKYTLRMPDTGRFEQQVSYPTGAVDIMILPADTEIGATTLEDLGRVDFNGRTFRRLRTVNLAPGDRFSLELGGGEWWVAWSKSGPFPWVIGGVCFAVLILVIWFRPLAGRAKSDTGISDIQARRDALVAAIANLDDRLDDGELSESDHRTRRDALKDELLRLSRELED